jgi:hypothetical protein
MCDEMTPIVGAMLTVANFAVPGNEWHPTEDLDTRPNGEPQMENRKNARSLGDVGFA